MPKIGSWGKTLVFEVNDNKKLSPASFKRSGSSKWNDHEIIGKKAKSEFVGPGMDSIDIELILDEKLGVKPLDLLEKIIEAKNKGEVNYLIINNKSIGNNKWAIDSISDTWEQCYSNGKLSRAKVTVSFREYR